ncbi:efflux RND transporter periplasmic adaptor subunit [Caulobacter sp. 17J80-11]|nr:efflux RND transporter periplasmic adaptor subunit [Caulobacter sp. 17J80-11]
MLPGCRKPAPPAPPQPSVAVAHPLVKEIVDWDEFVGRFEAVDEVDVRPQVGGYIQSVNFRDGQVVKKGQLLFVIDPRPFQAALAQARADVAQAQAQAANARVELERAQRLSRDGWVSRSVYDARVATAQSADAAVAAAKATEQARALDLGFTRVISPITGRVSDRRVSAGNLVSAAPSPTLLTTVVSLDPIRFGFTGSESVYLKYQRANEAGTRISSRSIANPVEIRLQDETAYRWRGHMDFVDNAIDLGSGTIRGRAVVNNPDLFLTPGMYGSLRLLGSGAYPALMIPDTAIQTDQADKIALVVEPDGKVAPRKLELGPVIDGLRVVRSGLSETDRVIVDGAQRVRPGQTAKTTAGVIKPLPPAAGPPPVLTQPASAGTVAGAGARGYR